MAGALLNQLKSILEAKERRISKVEEDYCEKIQEIQIIIY